MTSTENGCRLGYARVFTTEQDEALQHDASLGAGWLAAVVRQGRRQARQSLGLDALLAEMRPGDTLVVWRLDRLGRSLRHLLDTVVLLEQRGMAFLSLFEAIDTSTPGGKLLRRHIYPTLGDRALVAIKPVDVRSWTSHLSTGLQPATVKVVHGIVASIFLAAVDERRISSSPCQRRARSGRGYLPEVHPTRIEPMTTLQVEAIAREVGGRFGALVLLAAGTGLRQSEAWA